MMNTPTEHTRSSAYAPYIPIDRRLAITGSAELPDYCRGAALFADISGFTSLTETLANELGARRGADEMTKHLDTVYGALIAELERYRGSVISFAGDAITCWFDGDQGLRAVAAALSMQEVMRDFDSIRTPGGTEIPLSIKVGIASGPARRLRVGDPDVGYIDTLAGTTLDRMALAEKHARKGEVVVDSQVALELVCQVRSVPVEDGTADGNDLSHFVVRRLLVPVEEDPWPTLPPGLPTEEQLRPWILPAIRERLGAGQGRFLLEIRPAVPLFLRFGGIDYDNDPSAGQKLDAFVRWAQSVVARYGGSVIELTIGDKGSVLYSVFGAPIAHEDDPLRAVAAGIQLRSLPSDLDYVSQVQIGISWGRMRVGPYGGTTRRGYGCLGDQVNLAARLMSKAGPNELLVSERVAQSIRKKYVLRALGSIGVKGKSEQVEVSSVIGLKDEQGSVEGNSLTGALVGREEELRQISQALNSALAGQGQILRIEGPPGVGKSHLSAKLIEMASTESMLVATGACQSISEGVAYAPWRQAVRAILWSDISSQPAESAGAARAESPAGELEQIEQRVVGMNPDWSLRLPLLGDLLGLPFPENATTSAFDPKLRQNALFDLVGDMLESWAAERPMLLLIDDIHWMDAASRGLTVAVARRLAELPVLLTLVSRPPFPDEQILPECEQLPWHSRLVVGDLTLEGVASLLSHRLGAPVSPLVVSLIHHETHGNPFFVEEVADSLRESGGLQLDVNGQWALSGALLDALREADCMFWQDGEWAISQNTSLAMLKLGLPDSVEGAVLSRIDRLPEGHKLTLRVASVIGQRFSLELLARVHPLQPSLDEITEQVRVLENRDFARLEIPPPNTVYAFKHNITCDVAYETLLRDQGTQLHRAVGQVLESLAPDDIEQLAYHTFEGEDWPRATRYQTLAGQYAQRLFANHEAIEHWKKALVSTTRSSTQQSPPVLQQIAMNLGELFTTTGQYGGALEYLDKALQLAEELDSPSDKAKACRWKAYMYEYRGELADALRWIERGLGALGADETVAASELFAIAGLIQTRLGNFDQAQEHCERGILIAERLGEVSALAFACNSRAIVSLMRGDSADAVRFFERSEELYGQAGDIQGQAMSYNGIANAHFSRSRWPEADTYYRRARDVFNRTGDVLHKAFADNNLGGIALNQGRLGDALSFYQESLRALEQTGGSKYVLGALHMNLGATYCRMRKLEEAREHLSMSTRLFTETNSRDFLPELNRHLGETALLAGDLSQAEDHTHHALDLARELHMRSEEGNSLRVLGKVAHLQGDLLKAEQLLDESVTVLRELGEDYELSCSCLVLAGVLLALGRTEEASKNLDSCTSTFQRLEAVLDLEEAHKLHEELQSRVGA